LLRIYEGAAVKFITGGGTPFAGGRGCVSKRRRGIPLGNSPWWPWWQSWKYMVGKA